MQSREHFLTKNKKPFSDGDVPKGAMTATANANMFKDEKNELQIVSAISDVLLGASTVTGRVSHFCHF